MKNRYFFLTGCLLVKNGIIVLAKVGKGHGLVLTESGPFGLGKGLTVVHG